MKNVYSLLFFLTLFSTSLKAQSAAADYYFNHEDGVELSEMSSGAVSVFGTEIDDEASPEFSFFNFIFAGQTYNTFSVSANGVVILGSQPYTSFPYDNFIAESNAFPILLPWGEDLVTAMDGSVTYEVTGNAPVRKLVVDFKVVTIEDGEFFYNKHFQVHLFEGTNKIQFVYGQGMGNWWNNGTIGIASSATDYLSVTASDHSVTSTYVNTYNDVWPGAGQAYIFSPAGVTVTEPIVYDENTTVVTRVNCFGENNGAIALGTITGGDGTYNITWNGPRSFSAVGNTISGLVAGTYSYSISDASGSLPVEGTVVVSEPAALTLDVISTNASCDANNGSITVLATEGSTYTIVNESGEDVTSANGAYSAGMYTVVASLPNGNNNGVCTVSKTVLIGAAEGVTVSATVENVSCNGAADGKIAVTTIGGTSYKITNEAGADVTTQDGFAAGTYNITTTNSDGCTASTAVTVTEPAVLTVSAKATNVTCNGSNNGTITVTGLREGASYSIKDQLGRDVTGSTTFAEGIYTVTAFAPNGNNTGNCTATATVTIQKELPVTMANITISPVYAFTGAKANTIYLGYSAKNVTLSAGAIHGGSGQYMYSWSPSNGLNKTDAAVVIASPSTTTTYTLTVTDKVTKCTVQKKFTVNVFDVRNGDKKVYICHNGNVISVSVNAVAAHLAHGDELGKCATQTSSSNPVIGFIEEVLSKNVAVFPNPSRGQFSASLKDISGKATITIVNASGKIVHQVANYFNGKNQQLNFNLPGLPNGLYIMSVISESGISIEKVMIQH